MLACVCVWQVHHHIGSQSSMKFTTVRFSQNKSQMIANLNAILSKPRAQEIIFLPLTRVVGVKNDVAVSTIKFTNVLCNQWSFGTAIDSPNLENENHQETK